MSKIDLNQFRTVRLRRFRQKKVCETCNGRGWHNIFTRSPHSASATESIHSETCKNCNGSGYVDLGEIILEEQI